MSPRLSVVVPNFNRARYLDVFLRSLTWSALPSQAFEVIVVDDGSEEPVAPTLERWRGRGLDVRLIALQKHTGPRNNAVARNAGWRAARAPVVLQTDPDIVFASDVLSAACRLTAPGVFGSCSGYFPLTRGSTDAVAFRVSGAADGPEPYLDEAEGRPDQVRSPDGVGGLHGAFVIARDDLARLGGYDESFQLWGWEDRELLVTLADAGFVRQVMPDTPVVHLWHPPARGELDREACAREGRVSRRAWEVQVQRASAEHPRRHRPSRRLAPMDQWPRTLESSAYAGWGSDDGARMSAADHATKIAGVEVSAADLCLTAHLLEAEALWAAGYQKPARDLLIDACRQPWREAVNTTADIQGWRPHHLATRLFARLAEWEGRLGEAAGCDAALKALEPLPHGIANAAAVRARLALRRGDLARARAELDAIGSAPWSAERVSLALEIAISANDTRRAGAVLDETSRAMIDANYYEQLRLAEYWRLVRMIGAHQRPVPVEAIVSQPLAISEATEFVFSAAVRSEREGLDLAAALLYRRFAMSPGRSEPRLSEQARRGHSDALARVTVRAPGTVATLRSLASIAQVA